MTGLEQASSLVGALVDKWCDRRALKPLGIVLRAYPLTMGLTDDVAGLHEALRSARALCRDALPPDELGSLDKAISLLNQALNHR